jgi:hypothetical protein
MTRIVEHEQVEAAKALALDVLSALVPEVLDPARFEDPQAVAVMAAGLGAVHEILRATAPDEAREVADEILVALRDQIRAGRHPWIASTGER